MVRSLEGRFRESVINFMNQLFLFKIFHIISFFYTRPLFDPPTSTCQFQRHISHPESEPVDMNDTCWCSYFELTGSPVCVLNNCLKEGILTFHLS